MQAVTILGSPRLHGNTARVLEWVESALEQEGHAVERINVVQHQIAGCRECMYCCDDPEDLCAQKDDAIPLIRKMMAADLLILAAPVFCWGFPAQLKALIDRMFCLPTEIHRYPEHGSGIAGKPLALVVTAGGAAEDNADLLVKAFENMAEYMKATRAGSLVIDHCTGIEFLDDQVRAHAERFARSLSV